MPVRTECRLRLQTTSSGSKLQLECGLWAGDPALRSRIPGVSTYSGVQETSGLWESVVETLWGGANSTLCSGIVRLWPLLPLSQSHSLQLLSPSYRLFQGEKDRKPQSQLEAQRDSEEGLQKCKFCLQDQQTQGESSQSTSSRSLKMKCLHEEYKAHTSSIQFAEKPISPRATSSNPNSSRSRYYCTSRTLEESSPSN